MCDYSLHTVASRPAKVGDKLMVTDFAKSITRGFAAVGEPDVAVCLLRGRKWRSKTTSDTSMLSACLAEHVWIIKLLGSDRSTCTIRMSTTMRSNFPVARLFWSRG